MRTTPKLVLIFFVTALLLIATPSSPASAAGRVRSGMILSGTGESGGTGWVKAMEGCVGAPTCAAWLGGRCAPVLARKGPALHASIVDVADLADSARLLWVSDGAGINWGHYVVQFWTGTKLAKGRYCHEIEDTRVHGYTFFSQLRIPRGARWMTITSSPDNTQIMWSLR